MDEEARITEEYFTIRAHRQELLAERDALDNKIDKLMWEMVSRRLIAKEFMGDKWEARRQQQQ